MVAVGIAERTDAPRLVWCVSNRRVDIPVPGDRQVAGTPEFFGHDRTVLRTVAERY